MSNQLRVNVTGIEFSSPLLLASGYITETPDFFLKSIRRGCAAMVTRSLKKNPRGEVTAPRYYVPKDAGYMLNAEWGNEYPWTRWRDEWADRIAGTGKPLIISLSGRNVAECVELIAAFNSLPISAYEINVSCPHSGFLHGNLNVDFSHIRELVTAVVKASAQPVWVKLGYSSFITEMAKEAEACGADAIVSTNSIGPGLAIDTHTTKLALGIQGGRGGVSGKAIFPIALESVWTLRQALSIPVIASGGVSDADGVLQMLMAGASAVQLYTEPALLGPKVFSRIRAGLHEYCTSHATTISEIVGASLKWADAEHAFTARPPVVIESLCTGCGLCGPACVFDAISFIRQGRGKHSLAVIEENCITCNACIGVCPEQCIVPSETQTTGETSDP